MQVEHVILFWSEKTFFLMFERQIAWPFEVLFYGVASAHGAVTSSQMVFLLRALE